MGDRGATGGLGTVQGPMEELLGPHSHGWGEAVAQRRVHIPAAKQGDSNRAASGSWSYLCNKQRAAVGCSLISLFIY